MWLFTTPSPIFLLCHLANALETFIASAVTAKEKESLLGADENAGARLDDDLVRDGCDLCEGEQ